MIFEGGLLEMGRGIISDGGLLEMGGLFQVFNLQ